jgi:hypothetical protein
MVLCGLPVNRFSRYIDDIKISSKGLEEHYKDLEEVLSRFMKQNISIRLDKCEFFKKEVKYLGHIVDEHGVIPDREKVAALKVLPSPTCVAELLERDGKLGYYRRYIKNYSKIAAPFQVLKQKGRKWEWNPDHERAFRELIDRLCEAIMLHFPHPEGEWVIETDASYRGVGAILMQRVPVPGKRAKEERIIALESRGLRPSEKNYGVTEIEALAVVFAFERFRPYVLGQYVEVITDHSALRFIFHGSCTNARLMRWAVQLQEYEFHVTYRKGVLNRADILSRHPNEPPPDDYDHVKKSQAKWESMFGEDVTPDPMKVAGVHEGVLDKRMKMKNAAKAIVSSIAGVGAFP